MRKMLSFALVIALLSLCTVSFAEDEVYTLWGMPFGSTIGEVMEIVRENGIVFELSGSYDTDLRIAQEPTVYFLDHRIMDMTLSFADYGVLQGEDESIEDYTLRMMSRYQDMASEDLPLQDSSVLVRIAMNIGELSAPATLLNDGRFGFSQSDADVLKQWADQFISLVERFTEQYGALDFMYASVTRDGVSNDYQLREETLAESFVELMLQNKAAEISAQFRNIDISCYATPGLTTVELTTMITYHNALPKEGLTEAYQAKPFYGEAEIHMGF